MSVLVPFHDCCVRVSLCIYPNPNLNVVVHWVLKPEVLENMKRDYVQAMTLVNWPNLQ